jgi:hypothetical protein
MTLIIDKSWRGIPFIYRILLVRARLQTIPYMTMLVFNKITSHKQNPILFLYLHRLTERGRGTMSSFLFYGIYQTRTALT